MRISQTRQSSSVRQDVAYALCIALIAHLFLGLTSASEVYAKRREVTVPVEVGLGPAGHTFFNQLSERYPVYYGARLNIEAVIDKKLIKQNKRKIPKKYRKLALKLNEVRFRPGPLLFVPRTLFISPGADSSMYGAQWDLIGLGMGLGPFRLAADVLFTYAYLNYALNEDDNTKSTMHLVRPGLGLSFTLPVRLGERFGFNLGWRSSIMPPQALGGPVFGGADDLNRSIWHIGQAYLMFTYRIPYTTRL